MPVSVIIVIILQWPNPLLENLRVQICWVEVGYDNVVIKAILLGEVNHKMKIGEVASSLC